MSPKGGKRRGAGRPKLAEGVGKVRTLHISDEHYDHAKDAGNGNFSAGVRKIIEQYIQKESK